MKPHDEAIFALWQAGRRAGIPPQHRLPQVNDNKSDSEFDCDLDVIRKCLERTS